MLTMFDSMFALVLLLSRDLECTSKIQGDQKKNSKLHRRRMNFECFALPPMSDECNNPQLDFTAKKRKWLMPEPDLLFAF